MNNPTADILSIPIADIHVDDGYNVRSKSELHANAKAIAAKMEKHGDNQYHPFFRVRCVERDGKIYTRSHATLEAAKIRGWTHVNAEPACIADWTEDQLDLIASNNDAHPLTPRQQGEVFKRLLNGKTEKNGEHEVVIAEPIHAAEIARRAGCSQQHVSDCVAMTEAPDEIADMIESGMLSGNAFLLARKLVNKHHDGKPGKLLEVVRAMLRASNGERATPKHFEAIKDQFVTLKAATNSHSADGARGEPATGHTLPHETKPDEAKQKGGDASASADSKPSGPVVAAPASDPQAAADSGEEDIQELIPAQVPEPQDLAPDEERLFSGEVPAKFSAAFKRIIALIERWNDITLNTVSEEDVRRLASALTLKADQPF